ncbi:sugar transferase [Weissella diestrammenae]|uniref:Sugar transferase n=2 Tax=Weissella diestrammenae TaxID=1162633 RepID=A0A7G9T5L3_9LACO|nr:sugar transferase [Weissella diestrammenae]QNN75388.1 sugar transferase [Weissella diestrammenae]
MNMARRPQYVYAKRFLDISVALFALISLSPVFAIIIPFYWFGENRGPIFYRQRRIGEYGKPFYIFKFRSMVVGAEQKLADNPRLYHQFVANGYKLPTAEDPRITRFGAFVRKTSLDELPQFFNILIGDMTVIGPRPIVEKELKEYKTPERVTKFLSVRPGAMGLWQGSGRSDVQYPKRADIELEYVDNASMWFDFVVLFKNFIAIFTARGAE